MHVYIYISFFSLPSGKVGDCMYFLKHGAVDVELPTGEVVNSLADGSFFGGKIILLKQARKPSKYYAITIYPDVNSAR